MQQGVRYTCNKLPGISLVKAIMIFLFLFAQHLHAQSLAEIKKMPLKKIKYMDGSVTCGYFDAANQKVYDCKGKAIMINLAIFQVTDYPDCCSEELPVASTCPSDYPSLIFKDLLLTGENKTQLAVIASTLKDNPGCSITLTSYPKADKRTQSLAAKKLNTVKNYLVEKMGISSDRITTDKVIDGGDANTIDIKSN